MATNTRSPRTPLDPEAVSAAIGAMPDLVEQARLAGFGLAAPLVALRAGQIAFEARRSAAELGADDPETIAREADVRRFTETRGAFEDGLGRARVPVRKPSDPATGATIVGRVTEGGRPCEDVRVIASVEGRRVDYACTDANGGFGLDVAAGGAVSLSVVGKDDAALYRDAGGQTLRPGQQAYRDIDLSSATKPCDPPRDQNPVQPAGFAMVDLVGREEADAMALIRAQRLTLGERGTSVHPDKAGTILSQKPEPGAQVAAGDGVSIVVAITDQVVVPHLAGLSLDDARAALLKLALKPGEVSRKGAPADKVGKIVDQMPQPDEKVARGTAVAMVVGIASAARKPNADASLNRIADVAATRLAEATAGRADPIQPADVSDALHAAGVASVKDLDALLSAARADARQRLGVRTLALADRIVAALRKARGEMDG